MTKVLLLGLLLAELFCHCKFSYFMYLLTSLKTNFGYNFTNSYKKSGQNIIPLPISDLHVQLQFSEPMCYFCLIINYNNMYIGGNKFYLDQDLHNLVQ